MYYFSCPSCSNNTRFYRVRRESSSGSTGLVVFIFGGLLAALLFLNYERRLRVQCGHCGFIFLRPPMGASPYARTAMLLLYCVLLAALAGVAVELFPGIVQTLPAWEYVEVIRAFAEQHSAGVAVGAIVCVILMVVTTTMIALVSNWAFHRKIRSEHEYRPTELPPLPLTEEPKERLTHCTKCDYDLTGNVSGVCPECGTKIEEAS